MAGIPGLLLCWKHIDLAQRVVPIVAEINKTAEYVVYANSRVMEVLRALYGLRPEPLRQPDALVFAHRNGKERRAIRRAWAKACAAAGIEGLHVRGLRATAATRLQEGGATYLDIAAHLGHARASLGITARYVDPEEEHRRRGAELTIRQRASNVVKLRPRALEDSTAVAVSGTL